MPKAKIIFKAEYKAEYKETARNVAKDEFLSLAAKGLYFFASEIIKKNSINLLNLSEASLDSPQNNKNAAGELIRRGYASQEKNEITFKLYKYVDN